MANEKTNFNQYLRPVGSDERILQQSAQSGPGWPVERHRASMDRDMRASVYARQNQSGFVGIPIAHTDAFTQQEAPQQNQSDMTLLTQALLIGNRPRPPKTRKSKDISNDTLEYGVISQKRTRLEHDMHDQSIDFLTLYNNYHNNLPEQKQPEVTEPLSQLLHHPNNEASSFIQTNLHFEEQSSGEHWKGWDPATIALQNTSQDQYSEAFVNTFTSTSEYILPTSTETYTSYQVQEGPLTAFLNSDMPGNEYSEDLLKLADKFGIDRNQLTEDMPKKEPVSLSGTLTKRTELSTDMMSFLGSLGVGEVELTQHRHTGSAESHEKTSPEVTDKAQETHIIQSKLQPEEYQLTGKDALSVLYKKLNKIKKHRVEIKESNGKKYYMSLEELSKKNKTAKEMEELITTSEARFAKRNDVRNDLKNKKIAYNKIVNIQGESNKTVIDLIYNDYSTSEILSMLEYNTDNLP
jgi:hypothetical protein